MTEPEVKVNEEEPTKETIEPAWVAENRGFQRAISLLETLQFVKANQAGIDPATWLKWHILD